MLAAVPTGRLEDEREGRQMLYSCLRSVDSAGELAGEPNGKLYNAAFVSATGLGMHR